MPVFDAFKTKPSFDLEPTYAKWKDSPPVPIFTGNPKKDPSVDSWLGKIKKVCEKENIPVEVWHRVAQHYMGAEAKARLDELKKVMTKVNGSKYSWNWENFKIAMKNMGWNLDVGATETIKVHAKKSTGHWWLTRKDDDSVMVESAPLPPPTPKRTSTFTLNRRQTTSRISPKRAASEDRLGKKRRKSKSPARPPPRASPGSSFLQNVWPGGATPDPAPSDRPSVSKKTKSDSVLTRPQIISAPSRSDAVTVRAQAPVWLVNACTALDFFHNEHPRAMSTLAAILITVGTLPTIPAVTAGAGGAFLASSAAQAVGAMAVELGTWMTSQQAATPPDTA
ncbi:hypothetical protein C8J56DRAFT_915864 [Mycena floridula]|nr:hypothetical protein C8J56DRAFT_915864 [Mycena floridula]